MTRVSRILTGALAGLGGLMAAGLVAAPAMAQYGYYESSPRYYQQEEIYVQPRRGYHQNPGYYQQPQGYYPQQPQQRGYYQQPQYYNKEAAKDYWRAQKEAQKRAIKGGYYAQPQPLQPQYPGQTQQQRLWSTAPAQQYQQQQVPDWR